MSSPHCCAHVGARLAAFKVPAHVLVREEELPRNPTGKILKRQLRDDVRGGPSGAGRAVSSA